MHCRSNKPLTESNGDFSSASNSSRINWPMSREKRNIGNGGWAETEQSGWLSDYPVLRNICNLRLGVLLFSLALSPISISFFFEASERGRVAFFSRDSPPLSFSYRRVVGNFVSISQKSFFREHTFLSRGSLIKSPHADHGDCHSWPTRAGKLILERRLSLHARLQVQILLT